MDSDLRSLSRELPTPASCSAVEALRQANLYLRSNQLKNLSDFLQRWFNSHIYMTYTLEYYYSWKIEGTFHLESPRRRVGFSLAPEEENEAWGSKEFGGTKLFSLLLEELTYLVQMGLDPRERPGGYRICHRGATLRMTLQPEVPLEVWLSDNRLLMETLLIGNQKALLKLLEL